MFDSPINLGSHCAKGAAVREHGMSDRTASKYPMKLVNGKWTRSISWDDAINEVGDKLLAIRKSGAPDATYWVGSSKHNNEQAYLFRKFVAFSAPTTPTTRRASATRPRSRAWPIPGATAR